MSKFAYNLVRQFRMQNYIKEPDFCPECGKRLLHLKTNYNRPGHHEKNNYNYPLTIEIICTSCNTRLKLCSYKGGLR